MIASALGKTNLDHKYLYLENSNAYCGMFHLLSTAYQAAVDNSYQDTLLFGDRLSFFIFLLKLARFVTFTFSPLSIIEA